MKYLRVLLTKYPGRFSRLLALLSGRGFTHASIGLEGDGRFYSFSFRGFTEETPDKLRRRGVTAGRCIRAIPYILCRVTISSPMTRPQKSWAITRGICIKPWRIPSPG